MSRVSSALLPTARLASAPFPGPSTPTRGMLRQPGRDNSRSSSGAAGSAALREPRGRSGDSAPGEAPEGQNHPVRG